jgi:HEAT repeat protein
LAALADKDPDVRYLVGKLLVSLGQAEPEVAALPDAQSPVSSTPEKRLKLAVSLLVATLCDEDRDLRQAAAEALGRLGDARAQSPLMRAMADVDAGVRHAAELAMKSLAGARSA